MRPAPASSFVPSFASFFASSCLFLFALLSGGCATLPDGKPFADATGVWSATVKTSGQAVADSLHGVSGVSAEEQARYKKTADDFDAAWAVRLKAVDGVVAYSSAMSDLIGASRETDGAVQKVGDAVQGLAAAVNIPLAGPAVEVTSDVARFLLAQIALVRAAKQLEQSITAAQPAVDRIAEQLAVESKSLIGLVNGSYLNLVSAINESYLEEAKFARAFQKKQLELGTALLAAPGPIDSVKLAQLQDMDKIRMNALARLAERDQKLEQAAAAFKTRLQMINGLTTATNAWAAAHRDLAGAVRQKRKVNPAQLQETIADLKELIKKVRAL
jgi:hypothetical protein